MSKWRSGFTSLQYLDERNEALDLLEKTEGRLVCNDGVTFLRLDNAVVWINKRDALLDRLRVKEEKAYCQGCGGEIVPGSVRYVSRLATENPPPHCHICGRQPKKTVREQVKDHIGGKSTGRMSYTEAILALADAVDSLHGNKCP